jgi:hypothetical protein
VDNHQSWIFTEKQLSDLRATDSYHKFIEAALLTNTVIFSGITVDDIAVGGHLEALADQGINSGPHYWITSRTDRETDTWAERVGIRVVRYQSSGSDHSELLEALKELRTYTPLEDVPILEPVVATALNVSPSSLPTPSELEKLDSDTIRILLNNHVKDLIRQGRIDENTLADFRQKYDGAIYRSWYISENPGKNRFLGYTVQHAVKKGAFGSVYKAIDDEGNECAIKLLLEDIRENRDLTQSFRRGVTSMQILANHNVDGVVSYVDSSEIPAFVVMNWVEGPSLEDAVFAQQLKEWSTVLRCAFDLASILRKAHELPERVLHRDLRPANVMLENFYSSVWKLVVLDFDLSWHRDALERSVVHGATVLGYLAPEQIERTKGASTRHAGVDVFGLGMLLYFMVSGRHPLPSEHQHANWQSTVRHATSNLPRPNWTSIGARYERIAISSTRHRQSARWDLIQVQSELGRLLEAAIDPGSVTSADLIAEEIASRVPTMDGYRWVDDLNAARNVLPTGIEILIIGDMTNELIKVEIAWQNSGVHQFQNVGKWLVPAAKRTKAALEGAGWKMTYDIEPQALQIKASIDLENVQDLTILAESVETSLQYLRTIN